MKRQLVDDFKSLLCPPGNGVFTVNTAKERKDKLHNIIYPKNENPEKAWQQSLESLHKHKAFILGMPSDSGGGILRGANWGPLFLRSKLYEKDLPQDIMDLGDIRIIPHLLHDKYLNSETLKSCKKALYGDPESPYPVSPLSIAEDSLKRLYEYIEGAKVFTIGGDHSISYPAVKTYLENKRRQGVKVALIHFDAHTDLLRERLGIDICFGSWCPHILPLLQSPDLLVQLGIRSSAKNKEHWEREFGIRQFWSQEISEQGASKVAEVINDHLQKKSVQEVYISLDIDALDITHASATGTPEEGGLDPETIATLIEDISANFPLSGADIAEIAPFVQHFPTLNPEPETTLNSATLLGHSLIQKLII